MPGVDQPAPSCAAALARGLLDPERAPPAALRLEDAHRYDVYRNNITVSLIDALATIYPAVQRITGESFFRAMARSYARRSPPTSPLLFDYGRAFADFIATYEHARDMPWLADVARIERAWLDAYHAADAPPLTPEALAAVPHGALGDVVLTPHPATRVVRSPFPALTIFAANRADAPVGAITATEPEDALITRPLLEVTVGPLPPGGATFLSSLAAGEPLGRAAGLAFADAPAFDLAANLAGALAAGAFTALR